MLSIHLTIAGAALKCLEENHIQYFADKRMIIKTQYLEDKCN